MEEDKRITPSSKEGWSLSTHFVHTAVAAFSALCFVLSAVMWLNCPDPEAMAQVISSFLSN